jgi:hypothetical protein
MIVVEAGHAHVVKFLPLSCELSIFVAVTVIFQVKSAVMSILLIFLKLKIESNNIELFCTQFNSCV